MPFWPADLEPPVVAADDARRAAERILSGPAYREPQPSLVERVLDAITEFLGRAFDSLTGGGPGGVVGTVIAGLLVAVALWFLVRALQTRWTGTGGVHVEPVVHGTDAPDDPQQWLEEADRLGSTGDFRGALRCRHQAMAATVVRDGLVEPIPGRTPAELRRELVAIAPDTDDGLALVTDAFERAWYGGEAVSADQYRRFGEQVAAVESALREPSPQTPLVPA